MKCLTIKQPWASAIISGHKRFENRSWRTEYRGPLLIHAGLRVDRRAEVSEVFAQAGIDLPVSPPTGVILGVVDLVAVHDISESSLSGDPWAFGPFCWELANPRPLAESIPWRGRLGLFDVPQDTLKDLSPAALGLLF